MSGKESKMDIYREIGAFALAMLFAAGMFMAVPRQYPHVASYEYALELEKAIRGESAAQSAFYEFSRYAYSALAGASGEGINRQAFESVVMYLPPLLGLVCIASVYVSVRTRLGPEFGVLGAVLIACSSSFLINSLVGVYTPELFGVTAFSVSVAVFLASDVTRNLLAGGILAAVSGAFLGLNLVSTEAGVMLAVAMVASVGAQLAYYIKERGYRDYAIKTFILIAVAGVFVPYAKPVGNPQLAVSGALEAYVMLVPLVALFVIVGIRDLIHDTKKYELFFLAMSLASIGISLFSPLAAAIGVALGAVFGVVALWDHQKDRLVSFSFVALVVFSVLYVFSSKYLLWGNALALSALAGVLGAIILLLYDKEENRRIVSFGGVVVVLVASIASGAIVVQTGYNQVGTEFGSALLWAKTNLMEGSVVAAIGPEGMVEYVSGLKGCDCSAPLSRFFLGGGDTAELKSLGAQYLISDSAFLGQIAELSAIGNVTRAGLDAYFYSGYVQDQTSGKMYAYLVSGSGDVMRIPVGTNGAPTGEDVVVDRLGSVPYGRVRLFGASDAFGPGSGAVLPLYGERNNLFDIYFENPSGIEQVYPEGNATASVRIFRIE